MDESSEKWKMITGNLTLTQVQTALHYSHWHSYTIITSLGLEYLLLENLHL